MKTKDGFEVRITVGGRSSCSSRRGRPQAGELGAGGAALEVELAAWAADNNAHLMVAFVSVPSRQSVKPVDDTRTVPYLLLCAVFTVGAVIVGAATATRRRPRPLTRTCFAISS